MTDKQLTDAEIARLRREHAAMVAFVRSLEMILDIAESGGTPETVANIAIKLAVQARIAIASQPPSEPAPVVAQGTGERYGYAQVGDGIFYVADEDGSYLDPEYSTEESVQAEVARLNAALPASAAAEATGDKGAES